MVTIDPILKIEDHPFFLGAISPHLNIDVPVSLPFYLGVHPKHAVPVLILTEEIRDALGKVYSFGSMVSTPLGEGALSQKRMDEVLSKVLFLFGKEVKGAKFLEIGCGSGALLNELKIRGANVTGIEIGPQGQEASRKYGFEVVDKPISHGIFKHKFDCIFSYGCLEHIIELEEFFMASRECIKENGLFFHAVPNSEIYFNEGNLEHLIHQHINYFTTQNGVSLFNDYGFGAPGVDISSAGNELFLWGYYDSTLSLAASCQAKSQSFLKEARDLKVYADILDKKIKKIVEVIENKMSCGESIGFYAGGFGYSFLLRGVENIRFFDGDIHKHGKVWLRGFPLIESPLALKEKPVDNLIIFKSHYYNSIVKFLVNEVHIPDDIKIYELNELGL